MITNRAPASRLLVGASALLLVLFLPTPPAGAADNVAMQEVVPTVTITAGATTHNEPDGPMSFTLHASPVPAVDLEVKLDYRQTGVVFTDAIEQSFTETIPAGESSHAFEYPVVNDLVVEPEGTVTVPFFIRVHDGNPPGTFTSGDGIHEGVAFLLTTTPVTTDATTDFVYQSCLYSWDVGSFTVDASGDYTLTGEMVIEIIDDSDNEPGETFVVYFESPSRSRSTSATACRLRSTPRPTLSGSQERLTSRHKPSTRSPSLPPTTSAAQARRTSQ